MNIRKAEKTEKDCYQIFMLSNESLVRKNSFNTGKIEYTSHVQWYEKAVSDDNLLFFLVFEGDAFVGQIRFKRESETSEECVISLSITKQFRGKGIALRFLAMGIQELKQNWVDIKESIAEVKKENIASSKLFEAAGFSIVKTGSVNIYKLDIK